MKLKGLSCALALFAALLAAQSSPPTTLPAKPQAAKTRPRIGLVLSGGSALGLSHVGVIKWLQEHRIPVDAIGGTSMGGLIGGLYATGRDAAEIEEFVASIDWTSIFSPAAPFKELAFRRKEDRRAFPNNLEIGLKGGFKLPSGLSPGHDVGLVLSRFAAPYTEIRSFDDLPTPFRCVATDLVQGDSVIFRDGPLQFALRATMSLPGVFSPLADGPRLLVDGGLLNNLPVDVLKNELKPDVIIAVALIDPPAKAESISSILAVAGRSISVIVDANARRNLALADLVIAPELSGLKSLDFSKYQDFEQRGYEAADKKLRFLETLSVGESEWNEYIAARQQKRRDSIITPKFVKVTGASERDAEDIAQRLGKELDNKPIDIQTVDYDLTRLTANGRFVSADYSYIHSDAGDGLLVRLDPKPFSPPILNLGLEISGSDSADLRFGVGGRLTFLDLGMRGAEWRNDFSIGLTNMLGTEYYWRKPHGAWFLAPRGFISQDRQDLYEGKNRAAQISIRQLGFGGDLGYSPIRFSEFRLGYEFDELRYSASTGFTFPSIHTPIQTVRARYVRDTQDSPVIARRGIYWVSEARWNFSVPQGYPNYGTIETRFEGVHSFNSQYVFLGVINGGTTLGHNDLVPAFSIGGGLNVSALAQWQNRGDRYYDGGALMLRAFSADRSSSWNRAYVALGAEVGQAFSSFDNALPIYDGVIGFVSETPVGALIFGGSVGSQGNRKLFFKLGRVF